MRSPNDGLAPLIADGRPLELAVVLEHVANANHAPAPSPVSDSLSERLRRPEFVERRIGDHSSPAPAGALADAVGRASQHSGGRTSSSRFTSPLRLPSPDPAVTDRSPPLHAAHPPQLFEEARPLQCSDCLRPPAQSARYSSSALQSVSGRSVSVGRTCRSHSHNNRQISPPSHHLAFRLRFRHTALSTQLRASRHSESSLL